MTFSKSDIPHIKWSLLAFLLAMGASSAIIMSSEDFIAGAQRNQKEAKRQLSEARNQLATAEEDQKNMQAYTLEYEFLLKRNIIGVDRRLDWIEGLDRIHNQSHALSSMDFKYSIAPQKAYTPAPPMDSGNFELKRSDMALHLGLLHEGQLITFFDTLRNDFDGWFVIDQCALERHAAAVDTDKDGIAEQLKAECTGGWLTMKNRNEK